jgi:hypothetical protein
MATKGDVSDLDVLKYGGDPLVPLVSGFSRVRRSGVVRSDISGGATRQRKKYFNMPHICTVEFYLRSVSAQDFIQSFINRNEGKKFICYLSADRPIVEPYVVQALSDWDHTEVSAIEGTVTCEFEVFSTSSDCLDEFVYITNSCMGDDTYCIITGMEDITNKMPTT